MRWIWCLLGFATLSCPAAITIDDFSQGAMELHRAPGGPVGHAFGSRSSSYGLQQEGLAHSSVASGNRSIQLPIGIGEVSARVNTTLERFEFESIGIGYFELRYHFEPGSRTDLIGAGANAFRITIADLDAARWGGVLDLVVDGQRHSFAAELEALGGPGVIDIPFSHFTSDDSFSPAVIGISASRVPAGSFLAIGSLSAIPEPGTATLAAGGLLLLVCQRRRTPGR